MNASDQIRLVYQAMGTAPVDVNNLAKALGLYLHEAFLGDQISGMLEFKNGQYKISVNADHPKTRKRFTVAHELGHYLLHKDLIGDGIDDTIAYRSEDIGKYHNTDIGPYEETQANKFAASLLMPSKLVIAAFESGSDISQMAADFMVSEQSMEYRVKGLGLRKNKNNIE